MTHHHDLTRREGAPRLRLAHLQDDLQSSLAQLRSNPALVRDSRKVVDAALADGRTYYGINTGFGILAQVRVPQEQLDTLQTNLILSHAVGVGELIPKEIARLMLLLKVHALGLGYSGISMETFERLLLFAERDLIPAMPRKGSLGASGDLAPLAHLSLPLLGEGFFWDDAGEATLPAVDVLRQHGLEPIQLQAKDGLALINGTQQMSGYGAYVLHHASRLLRLADLVATMSLEALQGSSRPFDARIQGVRPHRGQRIVAGNVRKLLEGSQILESHRECGKVQDPYSLRCVPQVHGASRDALAHASDVVETEINAVTDNPLVFPDGDILSGGNFHGQPLALVLDYAAMALAEIASISERRTYLLLEGHDGLPVLLLEETGLNSGFMMPQYAAAALVSENKVLCHPASVDSIPSSRGQEDHVSMGTISAVKLYEVLRNVEQVLSIELMCAAQAMDFRRPLRSGPGIEATHDVVRQHIAHRRRDENFQPDMQAALRLVQGGTLIEAAEVAVGELG